jgi:hypothetical protein
MCIGDDRRGGAAVGPVRVNDDRQSGARDRPEFVSDDHVLQLHGFHPHPATDGACAGAPLCLGILRPFLRRTCGNTNPGTGVVGTRTFDIWSRCARKGKVPIALPGSNVVVVVEAPSLRRGVLFFRHKSRLPAFDIGSHDSVVLIARYGDAGRDSALTWNSGWHCRPTSFRQRRGRHAIGSLRVHPSKLEQGRRFLTLVELCPLHSVCFPKGRQPCTLAHFVKYLSNQLQNGRQPTGVSIAVSSVPTQPRRWLPSMRGNVVSPSQCANEA